MLTGQQNYSYMKAMITFLKELWKNITRTSSLSSTVSVPEPVPDTDDLLRRVIHTNPSFVRQDLTVTSFAFSPRKIDGVPERGVSVDISRLTSYERSIVDRFKYRLYSVSVNRVRHIGLDCEHEPIEGNDAHALIVGDLKTANCRKLARMAVRVPFPE
jgi:hypothetical protein